MKLKRCLIFAVVLAMLCSLMGCGAVDSGKVKDVDEAKKQSSSEFYTRVAVKCKEGEMPLHISKAMDGGVYVVTGDESSCKNVWHVDENDNWELKYDLKSTLGVEDISNCQAFVGAEGELFAEINDEHFIVDADGKKTSLKLDNSVINAKFIDDYLYVEDSEWNLFDINLKDFSINNIGDKVDCEYFWNFSVYDRNLIIAGDTELVFCGIDNKDKEKIIKDKVVPFYQEFGSSFQTTYVDVEKDELWIACQDSIGIYNFNNDESVKKKVVGTVQDEYMRDFAVSNGVAYSLIGARDNYNDVTLYKYSEDAEVASVSDVEPFKLKIWALDQMGAFDDVVKCFTDKYPMAEVEIEYGRDYEAGITLDDAIKNLNAEMLAGDGPDIIYTDGLNLEKYMESGQLYDMTEVINEIKDSGDYIDNILNTFEKDGKIYVVPSYVTLIGKVGTKEYLEASEDIYGFADFIEKEKGDDKKQKVIFEYAVPNYITDAYYRDIQSAILDGSIDRETLSNFFDASKKMFEVAFDKKYGISPFYLGYTGAYASQYEDDNFNLIINGVADIHMCYLEGEKMAEQINGEVNIPANDFKDCYVPSNNMAISASASNIEMAKEYIKVALGEDCQSENCFGFSVNKDALKSYNWYFHNIWVDQEGATDTDSEKDHFDELIEDVIKSLENVNRPIVKDYVIDDLVIDALQDYICEDADKETVLNNVMSKLELYMAE